jgi:hypothetical protein
VIEIYSSSDEEDFFADVTQDVEFAKWLFGDLNCDLLRPLSNGKVIVISDSDEETEAHEETPAKDEGASSTTAGKSSTPAASPADTDEDPGATPNDSNDGLDPGPKMGKDSDGGNEANAP